MSIKIPCSGLPDRGCSTPANSFFKADNGMIVKYVARCSRHNEVPRSAGLEEISQDVYVVTKVMES